MSQETEKFEENIESYKRVQIIMNNIKEGGNVSVKRFHFTNSEQAALDFVLEVLDANLKLLNDEVEEEK